MPENRFKLPKSARLHHRSLQERLFNDGSKLSEFPLKLIWNMLSPGELEANFRNNIPYGVGRVQVLVSVPKKKRRKAVDRVLLRRRIREAYRLRRPALLDALAGMEEIGTLTIGIIYMKEANASFAKIDEKLAKLLAKLVERVKEKTKNADDTAGEIDNKGSDEGADAADTVLPA